MKEVRLILADLGKEILSMDEAGFKGDIEENGTTFAENAEIKARAVWEQTGGTVLADDSGLVIDYLNGEPGVYSARYLENEPYSVKNRVLIRRMEGADGAKRSARFVCNIAAVLPDGKVLHTQAVMEGLIAREPAETGDSAMIRSCICRSTEKLPLNLQLMKRIKSAIAVKHWKG